MFVMLSHGEILFQTFSPILGHMVKIENFLNEVGEISIFCHGSYAIIHSQQFIRWKKIKQIDIYYSKIKQF